MNVMFLYFLDMDAGMDAGRDFLRVRLPGAGELAGIVKKVKPLTLRTFLLLLLIFYVHNRNTSKCRTGVLFLLSAPGPVLLLFLHG